MLIAEETANKEWRSTSLCVNLTISIHVSIRSRYGWVDGTRKYTPCVEKAHFSHKLLPSVIAGAGGNGFYRLNTGSEPLEYHKTVCPYKAVNNFLWHSTSFRN